MGRGSEFYIVPGWKTWRIRPVCDLWGSAQNALLQDLISNHGTYGPELMADWAYCFWNHELKLGCEELGYLKSCQMVLEGSTYSSVLALLAGWWAGGMRVFSSLRHKAHHEFFIERPSERINFGLVFLHYWRTSG